MKKLSAFVVALVATVAIGGMTAVAGQDDIEKVKTKVKAQYDSGPYDPYEYYEEAVIKAKVKAKGKNVSKAGRKKCKKKRTVVVKTPGGAAYAQDKTNRKGRVTFEADDAYLESGPYKVKAKKKKKVKAGIKCKSAKTFVQVDPYVPPAG